ncbi:hypothetical protein MT325_m052L [Paramecium bursaria chlorella virus MT325]|uniref:Uncharacterized protein m052L n=1 Tax=Paramecium bursaria Chlorella virus MT325 TaxID=346932 RepID=A7ITD2_PBCVM|nr:hypothetical protein MT325_m052L [Paramecium bursaria chlorella virus MT325]
MFEYKIVLATFDVNPVVGGTNDGSGEPPAPNMMPCNWDPSPAIPLAMTFPVTFVCPLTTQFDVCNSDVITFRVFTLPLADTLPIMSTLRFPVAIMP